MTATRKPFVRAKDVMDTAIHYIDGIATVSEAAAIMRKESTTTLIVEKRNGDDAWGLVVAQDIIRAEVVADKKPGSAHVYEIMSKPVVTVPADMDLRYVSRLMIRFGIRRTPVEEGGKLVGIVGQEDLLMKCNLF